MGTLKEDLKLFLEGKVVNCPEIFIDFMGEGVKKGIIVQEYGSDFGKLPFDYGYYARYIQISVKDRSGKKAENLAYEIYELLNSGLTEEEKAIFLVDERSVICRPKQLPFFIKKDEIFISYYGFNLIIHTDRR